MLDPTGDVAEGLGGEAAGAPLGVAAALDEVGAFEDFEVFGDGGEGDCERLGEFGDGGFTIGESREDFAARWVGERVEGGTEGVSFDGGCGHLFHQTDK